MNILGLIGILVGVYVVFMAIILIFVWKKSYKHTFIGHRVIGQNVVTYIKSAKEVTDKEGNKWWKLAPSFKALLKKTKNKIPVPDSESLQVKDNGGWQCYGYITSEDEVVWGRIDKEGKDIQPYISNEMRIQYIDQLDKANAEQGKQLITVVLPIACIFILAIVIIFGMVMWKDIAAPAIEADGLAVKMSDNIVKQSEILYNIENNIQVIKGEGESENPNNGEIPN